MKRGKKLIGLVVAVILGLSLILVPVVSRVSPAQAAVTWTKSGEVTLDSELYVVDACVIKESSTSYKMWYTHGKKDLSISEIRDTITTTLDLDDLIDDIANLDLEQFLGHLTNLGASDIADLLEGISTVIGYATSTDGKIWTKVNSEVLTGSSSAAWDSVGAPCVIWDETDGKYKMWYTRAKKDLTQSDLTGILTNLGDSDPDIVKAAILDLFDSFSSVIEYTTSSNGINWGVPQQVLPGSSSSVWDSVADPCVIKNSDTDYEMWYTRPMTNLTQTDLGNILADIGSFGIDDLLDILDSTSTVIGYATSSDGETWAVPDSQVLPEISGGAWDSVANPSVVKNSDTDYEMWYTNVKTNLIEATLGTLADEIKELDIAALWTTLNDEGIFQFITGLVAGIDDIEALLDSTSTVIGYATSSDGTNWTVQNSQHLVGNSITPWSGVAAPSVVRTGSTYEMWYTEGIGELTWQNLLNLVLGDNLPIGYASYTPAPPPPPPPTIETELFGIEGSFPISDEGEILEEIVATSEDEYVTITIEAGTIALDIEGEPLETLTAAVEPSPPEPPEGVYLIGAYDFGPDGATFDPPITLTWSYDPETLPEGMDLVIAYYDEINDEWVWVPCEVDTENNIITASVAHFTTFAIIAVPPVVVPPAPAAFSVSSLSIQPAEVEPAEVVTIAVSVANTGGESGSYTVVLKIDGVKESEKTVTIAAGGSETVTFSVTKEEADSYTVTVDGLSGSFTVAPVVVPPEPAAFSVSYLSVSPRLEVEPGETVAITVLVANTGGKSGSYTVVLKIDGVKEAEETVTVAAGESQDVSFSVTREEAGTYSVDVSGLTGSFTVKEEVVPKPITWWVWLTVGLGVVVIGGLLAYFLWWRRRIA